MKLGVKDIKIVGEGMQAKELIMNKYGSISNFIKHQNIALSEKAIITYLHQRKISSPNFRFRLVYVFDSNSYEELILNEEAQFKKYLDMIKSDILSYADEDDKIIFDKLFDLRQKYKLYKHSGELYKLYSDYFHNTNQVELAVKNIKTAIKLEGNPSLLMAYYSKAGLLYFLENELVESRVSYEEAERIRIESNVTDSDIVALHFYRYGILNSKTRSYLSARSMLNEAIKHTQDKSLIGSCISNIGLSYLYQAFYDAAIEHYNKALSIFLELDDKKRAGMIYNNIADLYRKKREYQKALNYFDKVKKCWNHLGNREKVIYTNTYYQIQIEMGNKIKLVDFIGLIDDVENLCPQKQYVIELFDTLINYGKIMNVEVLYKIKNVVNNLKMKATYEMFRKELMAIYGDISAYLDEGGFAHEKVNMCDNSSSNEFVDWNGSIRKLG